MNGKSVGGEGWGRNATFVWEGVGLKEGVNTGGGTGGGGWEGGGGFL